MRRRVGRSIKQDKQAQPVCRRVSPRHPHHDEKLRQSKLAEAVLQEEGFSHFRVGVMQRPFGRNGTGELNSINSPCDDKQSVPACERSAFAIYMRRLEGYRPGGISLA